MTLHKLLTMRRDSLGAKVLADHANGTPYCADFYQAGADAMLEILMPCVSALEAVEPLTDLADVSDALTALRKELGEM
jgi:hypothetical protein